MNFVRFVLTCLLMSASIGFAQGLFAPNETTPSPPSTPGKAFVRLSLGGNINSSMRTLLQNALEEAEASQEKTLLIVLNSADGSLPGVKRMVKDILSSEVKVHLLLDGDAVGPAMFLPFAADSVYMTPLSTIGGGDQMLSDEDDGERAELRALARSIVEYKGGRLDLIEAMIDPELEYKIGEKVLSKKGESLILTNLEAAKEASDGKVLLSQATAKDFSAFLEALGLSAEKEPVEASGQSDQKEPEDAKRIMVIDIDDAIMDPMLFRLRKGVNQAQEDGSEAIVLRINSPGGSVAVMQEMVKYIIFQDLPTYAFVEQDALSAAAIISYACDYIYMAPSTVIGDALPVIMTNEGYANIGGEQQEKLKSAVDAIARTIAQTKGKDVELLRAMVRPELEYKVGDEVISEKGELLTLTNIEAERLRPDGTPLLSEGTMEDFDAFLAHVGLDDAEQAKIESTWADSVASFILKLSPIIMMIVVALFYSEMQTPGFGIMGILAVLLFSVLFFANDIAGLAGYEDLLIIILGILLIAVEVFLLPGFGFAGIAGIALIFAGLIMSMTGFYPALPDGMPIVEGISNFQTALRDLTVAFVGGSILLVLIFNAASKSPVFRRRVVLETELSNEEGFSSQRERITDLSAGATGVATTDLRPSGVIQVEGKTYDVMASGTFLKKGDRVVVSEASGNRILVGPAPIPPSDTEESTA